jgi:rubrerythrin
MTISENIIEKFEDILAREKIALKIYTQIIGQIQDEFIIARLGQIKQDEIKHIQIAQEMLKLLKQ